MNPQELKSYIEQYQARQNGDETALASLTENFIIETIQKGLVENGYDISFVNKEGNLVSGEDAIDGMSGDSFNVAVKRFEVDFDNKKFEKEDLGFKLEIISTSESLIESANFYKDALDSSPENLDSYQKAMKQANNQNSYTIKISFDNESFINDGSISSEIRNNVINTIGDKLKEKGFDGKGLYLGLYDHVEFMDGENLKESNMLTSESMSVSTSSAPNGVAIPRIEYQFDVSEKGYTYGQQIIDDKKQIQGIVEETLREVYEEKNASLGAAMEKSNISLNWSQDDCSEKDACAVESNVNKGKVAKGIN